MKIFQAIETEYATIRSLHSVDGDFGARAYATLIIAGQLSPVLYALQAPYIFGLSRVLHIFLGASMSFILMAILVDRRRNEFNSGLDLVLAKSDIKAKLGLFLFMFVSTVSVGFISRFSWVISLGAYLLFAMLPLKKWITYLANKQDEGS